MIAVASPARKKSPISRWRRALVAAALTCAASGAALAAPYAITYTGTIGVSGFPEIINGQRYTVTFVFDNQGNSANSQTWTTANLTCAIWRMNNAGNVVFAQNLVTAPASDTSGVVTTDASGALTLLFSEVASEFVSPSQYTVSGIPLTSYVNWFANDANSVFYDEDTGTNFVDANSGGIRMLPAFWSAPTPFTGNCLAAPLPPAPVAPPVVTAVPALGEWSLMLLALGAAGLGARRLRKRD
ncbi:IPTL-CTERM sorting domain-containing protein [Ottowia thiooxydans]|uniref:IPTL-CTERM sorting domain-containing protein n=1 Tax=Ottowia thiooxydans TaxID=219182 RepID=UPI00040BED87|nr:IPTL-CTERM sorting domain-containing protein [Ottowia thiooxydans]